MAAKFGTSGLRGLSTELQGSVSALYATAFAKLLLEGGLAEPGSMIAVARDFRDSSPSIASTVIASLRRAGLEPVDCGTIATPALALYAMSQGAAAIMVTGSHIPADRNGIKFYRPDGEIGKSDELRITALAETLANDGNANLVEAGAAEDRSRVAADLFLARNIAILPPEALKGLRIGVYQHSTVARDMMVEVLSGYGAEVLPLGRSETFVPVDTEAVSADTLEKLSAWSGEHRLDAIISADGDGDRPLVADENGEPLRGDLLGVIAARFLSASVVATPVTSNSGIEKAGAFEVARTRVGSPFVIAAMSEALGKGKTGVLGFEANGGLMLASDFVVEGRKIGALPTRDSVLPALAVLGLSASRKQPLSEIARDFALPVALADRLENFATERGTALVSHLKASPENLQAFFEPIGKVASTSEIDGLRVTLEDGSIVHFRPSGNAPEMRCYVEASSREQAERQLERGLAALSNWSPT